MSQPFSIGPGNPAPRPSRVWGLGSIIGERQETIGAESDYEDMDEVAAAVEASFAQPSMIEPQDSKHCGEDGRKHIFISLNDEPGLDLFYTLHVHIELEESLEADILKFLEGYPESKGTELWDITNRADEFIADLRAQPGVAAADYMSFVHPWK